MGDVYDDVVFEISRINRDHSMKLSITRRMGCSVRMFDLFYGEEMIQSFVSAGELKNILFGIAYGLELK